MYPEVQAKAFEEINRVVGQDRLPTLADLDGLPYLEAIWKETLRWSPPFPISESLLHKFHGSIMTSVIL
jgi:cytochrome P450